MSDRVDFAVVGGGIVGLAVARELLRRRLKLAGRPSGMALLVTVNRLLNVG